MELDKVFPSLSDSKAQSASQLYLLSSFPLKLVLKISLSVWYVEDVYEEARPLLCAHRLAFTSRTGPTYWATSTKQNPRQK